MGGITATSEFSRRHNRRFKSEQYCSSTDKITLFLISDKLNVSAIVARRSFTRISWGIVSTAWDWPLNSRAWAKNNTFTETVFIIYQRKSRGKTCSTTILIWNKLNAVSCDWKCFSASLLSYEQSISDVFDVGYVWKQFGMELWNVDSCTGGWRGNKIDGELYSLSL